MLWLIPHKLLSAYFRYPNVSIHANTSSLWTLTIYPITMFIDGTSISVRTLKKRTCICFGDHYIDTLCRKKLYGY